MFRGSIGDWVYIIALPIGAIVVAILVARQYWRAFPSEAAARSEKSFSVARTFEQICQEIPTVAHDKNWKLIKADPQTGHFVMKVGMSLQTYGQVIEVDVSRNNEASVNLKIRCIAAHQLYDHGRNDRTIDEFIRNL